MAGLRQRVGISRPGRAIARPACERPLVGTDRSGSQWGHCRISRLLHRQDEPRHEQAAHRLGGSRRTIRTQTRCGARSGSIQAEHDEPRERDVSLQHGCDVGGRTWHERRGGDPGFGRLRRPTGAEEHRPGGAGGTQAECARRARHRGAEPAREDSRTQYKDIRDARAVDLTTSTGGVVLEAADAARAKGTQGSGAGVRDAIGEAARATNPLRRS